MTVAGDRAGLNFGSFGSLFRIKRKIALRCELIRSAADTRRVRFDAGIDAPVPMAQRAVRVSDRTEAAELKKAAVLAES